MIRRDGERVLVEGPVTLANVAQLIEQSAPLLAQAREVDLGGVTELDSSLLAVLIAWLRDAKGAGRELSFSRLPQDLRTLAQLYGVEQLLAQDAATR
jgi:phospholipid transport system transporter-binding protein